MVKGMENIPNMLTVEGMKSQEVSKQTQNSVRTRWHDIILFKTGSHLVLFNVI